jgi:hypothetical protein
MRNQRREIHRSIYIRYTSQFSHFSTGRSSDHQKQRIQSKQCVIKLSLTLYSNVMQHVAMNDHVSSSVVAYKQQHRQYLIRRKAKRRALLEERRVLLDTVHSNRPIHSLSIALTTADSQSEFLLDGEARSGPLDGTNTDQQIFDESISASYDRSGSDNVLSGDDGMHPPKNHLQLNRFAKSNDDLGSFAGGVDNGLDDGHDNGVDDGLDNDHDNGVDNGLDNDHDHGVDDDDSNEYLQLLSCFNHSNARLHDCTDVKAEDFCKRLLRLLRDASVAKAHCDRLLSLIYSGLPIPNTMPRTMKDLLAQMNGKKNSETLRRKDSSAQYRERHLMPMIGSESVP